MDIEVKVWFPRSGWKIFKKYPRETKLETFLDDLKSTNAKNIRIIYPIETKINTLIYDGKV